MKLRPAPTATAAALSAFLAAASLAPAAMAANPDLDAARALLERQRYHDALRLAQRAVKAEPANPAAHDVLGQALAQLGKPDEAIAELDVAVAASPKDATLLAHRGEAQMTRYSEGLAHWRREHGNDSMLGTLTSDVPGATAGGSPRYAPDGVPILGVTDKATVLTRNPHDAIPGRFDPGQSGMGDISRPITAMNQKERERYEAPAHAAMADFDKALALEPGNREALRGKAFAGYGLGEFADAGAEFEKANVDGTDLLLVETAADAYERAEAPNDAIRMWENAIRVEPMDAKAYPNLQRLYDSFRHSRWEGRYYTAMNHLLNGKPEDALDDLQWVTDHHPEYEPAWRATGSAYLAIKDQKQAVTNLEKAVSLEPGDGLAEYELGAALLKGADAPSAHKHFAAAAKLRPDYAPAWYSLGLAAEKENDPDTAIAGYQRATELRPNWAEAHYSLGALLLDCHEGAQAVEHLERYLALKPNAPDAPDVRKAVDQVKALIAKG